VHGQLSPDQPKENWGSATVIDYEHDLNLDIVATSLDCCCRLFVAAATGVLVIAGLNPLRLDARQSHAKHREMEQDIIDSDTSDRDLFLRFY
jgi:hypothetical protein